MKDNIIKNESFAFALRMVKLYQYLTTDKREYIPSKQLFRSGTSIGALVPEAEQAESNADLRELLKLLISIIKTSKAYGKR